MAAMFAELGFMSGVEIGVERGWYAEVLCKANPEATIYGIDPWRVYAGYRDHAQGYTQPELDTYRAEATERLAAYPNHRIVPKFSGQAVYDFEPASLDWVYIDGNHAYYSVLFDLEEWSHKVRPGGIIAGHDFRNFPESPHERFGIVEAVGRYTTEHQIQPWFALGRKRRRPGEIRDGTRSFMWVKS